MTDTAPTAALADEVADKRRLTKLVASVRRVLDKSQPTNARAHWTELNLKLVAGWTTLDAALLAISDHGRRGQDDIRMIHEIKAKNDAQVRHDERAARHQALGVHFVPDIRGQRTAAPEIRSRTWKLAQVTANQALARIKNTYGNTEKAGDEYTTWIQNADQVDCQIAGVAGLDRVVGFTKSGTGSRRHTYWTPNFSGVVIASRQEPSMRRWLALRDGASGIKDRKTAKLFMAEHGLEHWPAKVTMTVIDRLASLPFRMAICEEKLVASIQGDPKFAERKCVGVIKSISKHSPVIAAAALLASFSDPDRARSYAEILRTSAVEKLPRSVVTAIADAIIARIASDAGLWMSVARCAPAVHAAVIADVGRRTDRDSLISEAVLNAHHDPMVVIRHFRHLIAKHEWLGVSIAGAVAGEPWALTAMAAIGKVA